MHNAGTRTGGARASSDNTDDVIGRVSGRTLTSSEGSRIQKQSSPTQNTHITEFSLIHPRRVSRQMEERVVNFTVEAQQSLKEVLYAIEEGRISSSLTSSGEVAYLNLTTREGNKFTVRLCMRGFQVSP